jgi:hypothetical protein
MTRNWRQDMPSIQAYWIDRVLFDVHHVPGHLERYIEDPNVYMQSIPLPDTLKATIRDNEIGQMFLAGANPYLLRAHCLGLHISEADFLASLAAVAKEAGYG